MISIHFSPTLQRNFAPLLSSISEEDFVPISKEQPPYLVAYLEDYFDLAMTHCFSIFQPYFDRTSTIVGHYSLDSSSFTIAL